LQALDPLTVVQRVRSGGDVELELDGETVTLAADEIVVREDPGEGLVVSTERGITVAVETTLTPDLASEGLARDVVRRIQNLRKESGFDLDDRIVTTYASDAVLVEAVEQWQVLIAAETLSVELREGEPDPGAMVAETRVGQHQLTLGVRRV
jgi:isoleucyl-tRNA synthetase